MICAQCLFISRRELLDGDPAASMINAAITTVNGNALCKEHAIEQWRNPR